MSNENTPKPEDHKLSTKGVLSIALFILIVVSVSGFYMEMRHSSQDDQEYRIWLDAKVEDPAEVAASHEAPKYKNIPDELFKNNAGWVNNLNKLGRQSAQHQQLPELTDKERSVAVKLRDERRAYDGSPPVVPHAITTRETKSCVVLSLV